MTSNDRQRDLYAGFDNALRHTGRYQFLLIFVAVNWFLIIGKMCRVFYPQLIYAWAMVSNGLDDLLHLSNQQSKFVDAAVVYLFFPVLAWLSVYLATASLTLASSVQKGLTNQIKLPDDVLESDLPAVQSILDVLRQKHKLRLMKLSYTFGKRLVVFKPRYVVCVVVVTVVGGLLLAAMQWVSS